MSLDKNEEERLRAIERIRLEVQKEFQAQELTSLSPSRRMVLKLWESLNTPFILFFMSTIVIGLISWGYTTSQARRESRGKIEAELRHRQQQTLKVLEHYQKDVLALINNPKEGTYYYPGYAYKTAVELMNGDNSRDTLDRLVPTPIYYLEHKGKKFETFVSELRKTNFFFDQKLATSEKLYGELEELSQTAVDGPSKEAYTPEEKENSRKAIEDAIVKVRSLV